MFVAGVTDLSGGFRFEVNVLEKHSGGPLHAQTIVGDNAKEHPIARGLDGPTEAVELVLGQDGS
jgi:hypothetical protein